MFAVSSSSRSTTVQPPRVEPKNTQQQALKGQSNFVFVVPAANESIDSHEDAAQTALVSVVCVEAPVFDYQFERFRRPLLMPAQIGVADVMPAIERRLPEVDCRSHYDQAYDRIVYGRADMDSQVSANSTSDTSISAVEVMLIFKELGTADHNIPPTREAARWQPVSWILISQIENYWDAMYVWIRFNLYSWAQDFGLAGQKPTTPQATLAWTEYSDLMDEALAGPNGAYGAAEAIVRFGDRLWHYAALSWDRTLQALFGGDQDAGPVLTASLE
jgi:hypothetical protein